MRTAPPHQRTAPSSGLQSVSIEDPSRNCTLRTHHSERGTMRTAPPHQRTALSSGLTQLAGCAAPPGRKTHWKPSVSLVFCSTHVNDWRNGDRSQGPTLHGAAARPTIMRSGDTCHSRRLSALVQKAAASRRISAPHLTSAGVTDHGPGRWGLPCTRITAIQHLRLRLLGVSCLFGSCLGYCAAVLSTTAFASRVGRRLGGFSGFRAAALRRTRLASPGDLQLGTIAFASCASAAASAASAAFASPCCAATAAPRLAPHRPARFA